MTALELQSALQKLASPEKAKASAWFFKTVQGQYGEGDQFLGVTVPEQRRLAKQFRELPLAEIAKLLQSPIHEHRLTALFILVWQYQQGIRNKAPEIRGKPPLASTGSTLRVQPEAIVDFYLAHRSRVNNWDLVDSSAGYILGDWLLANSMKSVILSDRSSLGDQAVEGSGRRILYDLAKSKSLWDRRIAIIATQAFIAAGQFDDTLRLAELLLTDKEDLMHKATGWMLREVGKRDVAVLRKFLDAHATQMPRTMLRYAIEKLPEAERKQYLAHVPTVAVASDANQRP